MTTDNTARAIAQALGETAPTPCGQIERMVQCCGAEQALAWLSAAQQIEANGGMRTRNGSRRRTPGGVFFYLVRQELLAAHRHDDLTRIFGRPMRPTAPPAPVTWDHRNDLVRDARDEIGKATTVKITLIGRPARTVERQQFTLLMLTHSGPLPALPKGIPIPTPVPETTYIVYIGAKQWKHVQAALADPTDALIVEGVPVYDAQYTAIAVFATQTTTKALQRAKRQS